MRRIAIPAAVASIALLALPATSGAFKFGAKLDREPANSAPPHDCAKDGGDDIQNPCTRVLVKSETGLVNGNLTSPKAGKLTKIRVRAGAPGSIRFKLVRLKDANPVNGTIKGKAVAKSKVFQVQGNGFNATNPVEAFNVNMTVRKGDYLGFDSSKTSAELCSSGGVRQFLFHPTLTVGDPFQSTSFTGSCTLMVQAIGHT